MKKSIQPLTFARLSFHWPLALLLMLLLPGQSFGAIADDTLTEGPNLPTEYCTAAEIRPFNLWEASEGTALPSEAAKTKQAVQLALLLDTSNSMDGLITQAKSQLWDIVNELAYVRCHDKSRPDLQIALYEYGNDNLSSEEGYIRQVVGFTGDLDLISEKLFALTTNGGEEFCGEVIHTSLEQLIWNKNPKDLRLIFIAGNEPFDQGTYDYTTATEEARRKGVVVNTIFCGRYRLGVDTYWKDGAQLTGGKYSAINHNDLRVEIDTPYDDIIIRLNKGLNSTYIQYGARGYEMAERQMAQDANASSVNRGVAVKRAVSKSSSYYKNTAWDLVDAYEQDEESVLSLDKEDLPEELQDMSKSQIKAYIQAKQKERDRIQKEISEANAKREKFLAENQEKAGGELENALISALRDQASAKGFVWVSEK